MTRKELLRLLSSGHGRAAKYILERGADEYAALIAQAVITERTEWFGLEGFYTVQFAKAMTRPEAMIDPLLAQLKKRMPGWRRRRLLLVVEGLAKAGFKSCRPVLREARSQRLLNPPRTSSTQVETIETAADVVEHARAGRHVSIIAASGLPGLEKWRLIEAAYTEEEPKARGLLVRAVHYSRCVPVAWGPLVEAALGPNGDERHWAIMILGQITHPSVRELALRLARGDDIDLRYAGKLIEANILAGDAPMVRAWFERAKSSLTRECFGIALRRVAKRHPGPEWEWVLPYLYENLECQECRGFVVLALIRQRRFSVEWAEEGVFDSDSFTRRVCKKYLRNRKRSTTELRRLADV